MDALAGIIVLGSIVGFIVWLASKSRSRWRGEPVAGLPEPTLELARAAGIEFLLKKHAAELG
jgi:hypothetical protein